jgi:hypothetical protein
LIFVFIFFVGNSLKQFHFIIHATKPTTVKKKAKKSKKGNKQQERGMRGERNKENANEHLTVVFIF